MALLASKSQYAPHQLSSQYTQSIMNSPTSSDFASSELLDDIRSWNERQVSEWLRTINCGKYNQIFESNNITGETLLECDQTVLKDLGVTKVGDRVRIFVAVKALRNKAFGNARKRNRDTLASLDNFNYQRPEGQSRKPTDRSYTFPDSPNEQDSRGNGSRYNASRSVTSPPLSSSHATPTYTASTPGTGRTPITPGPSSSGTKGHKATPSLEQGIMGFDKVRQHCVKMIGSEGQTRIVQVSSCTTAQQVYKMAMKKFGIDDDVNNYCIYITTEENIPIRLSDAQVMELIQDVDRPERGRLIFRRKNSPMSSEEYKRAVEIAREQQDQALLNSAGKSKVTRVLGTDENQISQPPQRPKRESRDQAKKITAFFGQRPPSELISSNLAEYFPGQEDGVLERTVRNSIRRSTRMSRYQSRLSIATTRSYASSISDVPPVPNVADAWLKEGTATLASLRRPLSVATRKSILPSTAYNPLGNNADMGLSPLTEESPLVNRRFFPENDSPNVVVTDTDGESFISRAETDDGQSFLSMEGYDSLEEEEEEEPDENRRSWIQGALIGSGSFGSVFLALNAFTGAFMAVKQVELPSGSGAQEAKKQSMVDALQQEIALLKDLHHPNIVQYLGSTSENNTLNIFLEYVPGGSVATMLKTYGPLQEPLIRKFVREILAGLSYLHNKDIIHRDIKGANVLVDNNGNIKISDFGISKKIDAGLLDNAGHRPSLQGSVFWMAPEVVKQTSYTRKADIWSLGCLVVEMFTGSHPYPDCSQLQAIFKIGTRSATPDVPEKASAEAKTFMRRTFEVEYEKRPSADELLTSPFCAPIIG